MRPSRIRASGLLLCVCAHIDRSNGACKGKGSNHGHSTRDRIIVVLVRVSRLGCFGPAIPMSRCTHPKQFATNTQKGSD